MSFHPLSVRKLSPPRRKTCVLYHISTGACSRNPSSPFFRPARNQPPVQNVRIRGGGQTSAQAHLASFWHGSTRFCRVAMERGGHGGLEIVDFLGSQAGELGNIRCGKFLGYHPTSADDSTLPPSLCTSHRECRSRANPGQFGILGSSRLFVRAA